MMFNVQSFQVDWFFSIIKKIIFLAPNAVLHVSLYSVAKRDFLKFKNVFILLKLIFPGDWQARFHWKTLSNQADLARYLYCYESSKSAKIRSNLKSFAQLLRCMKTLESVVRRFWEIWPRRNVFFLLDVRADNHN